MSFDFPFEDLLTHARDAFVNNNIPTFLKQKIVAKNIVEQASHPLVQAEQLLIEANILDLDICCVNKDLLFTVSKVLQDNNNIKSACKTTSVR